MTRGRLLKLTSAEDTFQRANIKEDNKVEEPSGRNIKTCLYINVIADLFLFCTNQSVWQT